MRIIARFFMKTIEIRFLKPISKLCGKQLLNLRFSDNTPIFPRHILHSEMFPAVPNVDPHLHPETEV